MQDFFRRFTHLAGMTGTAATSAREFAAIYKMPTFVVPTHRPSQRRRLPSQIFTRADAKSAHSGDGSRRAVDMLDGLC